MSPEQAHGKPADRGADIWSFGAVLFEMLAGKSAFSGESVSGTLAAVLKSEVDWGALPPGLRPACERFFVSAWQRTGSRDSRQSETRASSLRSASPTRIKPRPISRNCRSRGACIPGRLPPQFQWRCSVLELVSCGMAMCRPFRIRASILAPEDRNFVCKAQLPARLRSHPTDQDCIHRNQPGPLDAVGSGTEQPSTPPSTWNRRRTVSVLVSRRQVSVTSRNQGKLAKVEVSGVCRSPSPILPTGKAEAGTARAYPLYPEHESADLSCRLRAARPNRSPASTRRKVKTAIASRSFCPMAVTSFS